MSEGIVVYVEAPEGTPPKWIAALANMEARSAAEERDLPYPPWITVERWTR